MNLQSGCNVAEATTATFGLDVKPPGNAWQRLSTMYWSKVSWHWASWLRVLHKVAGCSWSVVKHLLHVWKLGVQHGRCHPIEASIEALILDYKLRP